MLIMKIYLVNYVACAKINLIYSELVGDVVYAFMASP